LIIKYFTLVYRISEHSIFDPQQSMFKKRPKAKSQKRILVTGGDLTFYI